MRGLQKWINGRILRILKLVYFLLDGSSLSTIAGSPVDPRSKAIETRVVREKDNPRSYVSFLDDDCPSVMGSGVMLDTSDQSEIRIGQPRFDDTGEV